MGRKKSDPPNAPLREPALVVKGTKEWKAWIEDLATHLRMTKADMADRALIELAERTGYKVKPPIR